MKIVTMYFLFSTLLFSQQQAETFYGSKFGNDSPTHLVPSPYPIGEYQARLVELFSLAEGRLGKMVVVPSWQPEYAIAVDRVYGGSSNKTNDSSGAEKFKLVSMTASANLHSNMEQRDTSISSDSVKIILSEKFISKKLAAGIQRVFAKSIIKTRYPEVVGGGVDGTTFQFTCFMTGYGQLYGECWEPQHGIPSMLVKLGENLYRFGKHEANINESKLLAQIYEIESLLPQR